MSKPEKQEFRDGLHMVKVFEEDDMTGTNWMLHMDCDCVGFAKSTVCSHVAVVGHCQEMASGREQVLVIRPPKFRFVFPFI